jgi:hypothetical protein
MGMDRYKSSAARIISRPKEKNAMPVRSTTLRRKLADNVKRVRERIQAACQRCGRDPDNVTLVPVTKSVEVNVIRTLIEMGLLELGENRGQELVKRAGMIHEHLSRRRQIERAGTPGDPCWHMVGHLQRNKVRALMPWVGMVHSVDSLRLAETISTEAVRVDKRIPILLQVNVAEEKSKFGLAVGAVPHLAEHIKALPGIEVAGLMTMAPWTEDPGETRTCFTRLREIFEDMHAERIVGPEFRHLSMGMSHDFEIAVEEGATIVRIGTALFEGVS